MGRRILKSLDFFEGYAAGARDFENCEIAHDNFSNRKFAGVNLQGSRLIQLRFDSSDLSRSDLRNVELQGVSFVECDLTSARLGGTKFDNCRMERANFRAADLGTATFDGCELSGAIFEGSGVVGTSFARARLNRANLKGVTASDVSFYAAELSQADLSGANLSKANLKSAKLYKADLRGTDLSGAIGLDAKSGARFDASTIMPDGRQWNAEWPKTEPAAAGTPKRQREADRRTSVGEEARATSPQRSRAALRSRAVSTAWIRARLEDLGKRRGAITIDGRQVYGGKDSSQAEARLADAFNATDRAFVSQLRARLIEAIEQADWRREVNDNPLSYGKMKTRPRLDVDTKVGWVQLHFD